MEIADFQKMNGVRARVDQTVDDPATAEALKPWYRQFCKRPTFNDEYLPTFNRPNVKLVDTSDSQGVERITKTGVVANGVEYQSTASSSPPASRSARPGRGARATKSSAWTAQTLTDYWADGMRTLHGFSSHGFPNCFFLGQSQNGASVNLTSVLDDQAQHIGYIIKQVMDRGPSLLASD